MGTFYFIIFHFCYHSRLTAQCAVLPRTPPYLFPCSICLLWRKNDSLYGSLFPFSSSLRICFGVTP